MPKHRHPPCRQHHLHTSKRVPSFAPPPTRCRASGQAPSSVLPPTCRCASKQASAPPRCRLVVAPAGPLSTFSRSAADCPAPTARDTVDCRVNGCTLGVFLESSAPPPTRCRASEQAPSSAPPPTHRRASVVVAVTRASESRRPHAPPPASSLPSREREPTSARASASVVVAVTQASES